MTIPMYLGELCYIEVVIGMVLEPRLLVIGSTYSCGVGGTISLLMSELDVMGLFCQPVSLFPLQFNLQRDEEVSEGFLELVW